MANKNEMPQEQEGAQGTTSYDRRILRVDKVWSKKDRQWHFVKTAKPKTQDRFRKYMLVAQRKTTRNSPDPEAEVHIKSPKLADLLIEIFKGMDGVKLTGNPPLITSRSFFHAYPKLTKQLAEEQAKDEPDTRFIEDLKTALVFLDEEFSDTRADLESLVEHGDITYNMLWALFQPREVVFSQDNLLRAPQAARLVSLGYYKERQTVYFGVMAWIISHDGMEFGWGSLELRIPSFDGTRKIVDLPVFPMRMHPQADEMREKLRERGRAFIDLVARPSYCEYEGMAVCQVAQVAQVAHMEQTEECFLSTGRIMIDPVAFQAQNPNDDLIREPHVYNTTQALSLSEDDLILCNYRGFSFVAKKWGVFVVSSMVEVVWNHAAFDRLILDDRKRRIIRSLVLSHRTDETAPTDDVVAGKDKGLVGLLSGSPGVGKTLTAEVMAEISERPLYIMSAGELGTTVDTVDDRLGMVLDITRRWRCVLLIDEADVFLYKRGETHLERNAVVSVFLRRLEYFQGIIILTTNRQKDIDEAFRSRIHFKFHYPPLDKTGRLKIWKSFIANLSGVVESIKLSEHDLEHLSERPMNGREIKNTISCAASIVRWDNEPLTLRLLVDTIESLDDGVNDDDAQP